MLLEFIREPPTRRPLLLQAVRPMRALRAAEPLDHPEFVYEPKIDGFCALAHIPGHRCEARVAQRIIFEADISPSPTG